ncbi:MAG: DsrE family protein [Deltaproteobacteria bacterium]|nr:DsrE family protein [Deltaproteobacteria bacterium]MDQ3296558.1 DsrE family protein [Myxococcota bacterium]
MKILLILSDPPYGTEKMYNGLRLAATVAKKDGAELKVFLLGDSASGAHNGQKVPAGYYNIQTMIGALVRKGIKIGVCGTCMDARGLTDANLLEGAHRSTMDELAEWTVDADKVITF